MPGAAGKAKKWGDRMYRIAVADDEAKACTMIKEIIQQYFEAKALECRIQSYQRPTEMVWDMEKGAGFDIFCIDIEMPGISGMELAHQIRQTDRFRAARKYYVIENYDHWIRFAREDIYYLKIEKKYTYFYTKDGTFRERRPFACGICLRPNSLWKKW